MKANRGAGVLFMVATLGGLRAGVLKESDVCGRYPPVISNTAPELDEPIHVVPYDPAWAARAEGGLSDSLSVPSCTVDPGNSGISTGV